MKAIVVTDQAAGTAGMKLVERPEPRPAPRALDPLNPMRLVRELSYDTE